MSFNIQSIRDDFPILQQTVHGKPLVYLDNAATSQKPRQVIAALADYYQNYNANVHRGLHELSERATQAYENTREKVALFVNAKESREIVFVRGTTEAINLVANSFVKPRIKAGDEILITEMEHHSNIVPWELICQQTGAVMKRIPVTESGELDLIQAEQLINERTRLLAVVHISNVLGTINPIKKLTQLAHAKNVPVLVDGAQGPVHLLGVDVQDIDCDFYTLSGHKMLAPTGIGALYGKAKWLEEMQPYHGGGEMVEKVSLHSPTIYKPIPFKFEAGTPNIADTIAFGTAIDYINALDKKAVRDYEKSLYEYVMQAMQKIPNIRFIGTAQQKAAIITFVFTDLHAQDVATMIDQFGIAIRSGHHCAMPLMEKYEVTATLRASLLFYNTKEEIDKFIEALLKVREMLL